MPHLKRSSFKYMDCLDHLENEVIYSASSIADKAMDLGLYLETELSKTRLHTKIRHTLSRLARQHQFPRVGDGFVEIKGQPLIIGWQGQRWKSLVAQNQGAACVHR